MGVNGLNKFINEKHPSAVTTVPLTHFSGTNVAIDASLSGYTFLYNCYRNSVRASSDGPYLDEETFYKLWFGRFVGLIRELQKCNIVPVFIFDGEAPKEKELTKAKRTETLMKSRAKVDEMRKLWDETNPIERNSLMLLNYKNVFASVAVMPDGAFERLMSYLDEMDIGWCKSKKEADHLCAAFSMENAVSAVLSTDSDLLVHGVENLIITDIGKEGYNDEGIPLVKVIMLSPLLESLGLDAMQLLDLAILAGTDYNPGIARVGPNKALGMVKSGNVPEEINDMSISHIRSLFTYKSSSSLIESSNLDF